MERHVVYLFRNARQGVTYVGRGQSTARPEQGVTASHNPELRKLVEGGQFTLEVAGPYGDMKTAAAVEAALISALSIPAAPRLVNVAPGDGPKFAPLGVPIELADRLTLDSLSLPELGMMTGGILLVRLASGGAFKNDELRRKFDPSDPDDRVVAENVVRWWWLRPLIEQWKAAGEWPKVVAGLAGPPKRRYVAGALKVDPDGIWSAPDEVWFEAPTILDAGVDAHELRGRLVNGALFNQIWSGLFIWVDGAGNIRYLPPRVDQGKAGSTP